MDPRGELPDSVRALIFDCDGTLVDTMPAHYRAWCAALDRVGLSLSRAQFYALAGVPTVSIVELLSREQGVACDPREVGREKDRLYVEAHDHGAAIEVVAAIARRERGVRRLAVASGNTTDIVRMTLRGADLEELFDVVVGADQVTRGKPSPDVFLRAAQLLDVEPSACAVYEDADLGLQAARAASMIAIDVRRWLGG